MKEITREISLKITFVQQVTDEDAEVVVATAKEKVVKQAYADRIKTDVNAADVKVTKIKDTVMDVVYINEEQIGDDPNVSE